MDIATLLGFIGGAACIVMSVLTSGGTLGGIFDVPSLIFVLGGSFFALFIAYPMSKVLGVFAIMGRTFKLQKSDKKDIIRNLVGLSERARREGLLAMEESLEDLSDKFLKSGLRLAIDGVDGAVIKTIMEKEINEIETRHMDWMNIIIAWAGLAPGYGMMGTVIGLIGMLRNLEDKSSLGPNMAVALVTTLYGSLIANWIMTPIATKLSDHNAEEISTKEMILEGVLSIQGGDNPRILLQKLLTYMDPKTSDLLENELAGDK